MTGFNHLLLSLMLVIGLAVGGCGAVADKDKFEMEVDKENVAVKLVREVQRGGYDVVNTRRLAARAFEEPQNKKKTAHKRKTVPLKFHFPSTVQKLELAQTIRNNAHLLPSEYTDSHRLVTCFLAGRSLFRERYGRFF